MIFFFYPLSFYRVGSGTSVKANIPLLRMDYNPEMDRELRMDFNPEG